MGLLLLMLITAITGLSILFRLYITGLSILFRLYITGLGTILAGSTLGKAPASLTISSEVTLPCC
jgi:hypothetical protein